MGLLVLILLCVVQGFTEFLPVSSSGHLLLLEQLFGLKDNLLFLNLFLHLATLAAVLIVYRKIVIKIIKKPFQKYTYKLLVSTIITIIFAIVYEKLKLDSISAKLYCFGFLITSILLFFCYKFQKKTSVVCDGNISFKQSILVGTVQGIAVVPGLSRSGSTIASLVLSGGDEEKSAEYSFLLSVPIIVGGFIVELIKNRNIVTDFNFSQFITYIFAFFLTFIVAICSLKLTIKLLKKQRFIVFSIWTFILFLITFIFNFVI